MIWQLTVHHHPPHPPTDSATAATKPHQPTPAYSRPMRWILAIHGDTPLPFAYGPLLSGTTTRVLRNAAAPEQAVASAEEYGEVLAR